MVARVIYAGRTYDLPEDSGFPARPTAEYPVRELDVVDAQGARWRLHLSPGVDFAVELMPDVDDEPQSSIIV